MNEQNLKFYSKTQKLFRNVIISGIVAIALLVFCSFLSFFVLSFLTAFEFVSTGKAALAVVKGVLCYLPYLVALVVFIFYVILYINSLFEIWYRKTVTENAELIQLAKMAFIFLIVGLGILSLPAVLNLLTQSSVVSNASLTKNVSLNLVACGVLIGGLIVSSKVNKKLELVIKTQNPQNEAQKEENKVEENN
ncbi:hypothetical protein [Mycoplasmopsis glycophila]|uniref:Uncharacterized protein n=1 Tax=Mycoplasmopsis glycophila TaxID=171285 RepID=A0A449AWC2_9BACT|nr:hypothetical protein [Mycoplasmopsis glycophila]VEU71065.1 Uncharacterised protein [Mycoplasmopsis glycophila]